MTMANKCFIPILGKKIRVTRLDSCGNYPEPQESDAYIVTEGFITVELSAEVEEGTEILQRNARGALCVNEKLSDSFKRFTVDIEFCGVNPALVTMLTNAEPYEDYAGDVAGFTMGEGTIDKAFALELWTGLAGGGCDGGQEASGYLLLPFVQSGIPDTITIDGENAVNFSLTGSYTKGGNQWGVGPFDVVMDDELTPGAAPLPTPLDPLDHLLLIDTDLAPPQDACDPQAMPGGA